MRCVFVSDKNPVYTGFWEQQAIHMWTMFGLRSTLYYITDETSDSMFRSDFADVTVIPLLTTVPAIVQALFAKWYFPGLESSTERILICDIDCFLLSRSYITRLENQTNLYHLNTHSGLYLPGYYVSGTPSQIGDFFQIRKHRDFEEFCLSFLNSDYVKKLDRSEVSSVNVEASPNWMYFGSEERFGEVCRAAYTGPVATDDHPNKDNKNRIDREAEYDEALFAQGKYIDFHCPRPFEKNADTIRAILKKARDLPSFCIVYLASPRGFHVGDIPRIELLRTSLRITKKHFPTTPIYIFHEDYTEEDKASLPSVKEYITVDFSGQDDKFDPSYGKPKGYMMMNRFFTGIMQAYPQIQRYSHYMRMDDDSFLLEPYLTEEHVKKNHLNQDYVYRVVYKEEGTIARHQGLYQFTLEFLREEGYAQHIPTLVKHLKDVGFVKPDGSYTCDAPYNNWYVSSMRLWNNSLIQKYIQKLEREGGILTKGWYESTIQAMMIRILALFNGMKILHDGSFGYRHNAHFAILNSKSHVHIGSEPFYPKGALLEDQPIAS